MVLAVAAVAVLAGCSATGSGSSAGGSFSSLHCPSLAVVKTATGFTDLTHSNVSTNRQDVAIICSYTPAANANPVRQVEVLVTLSPADAADARQDAVKEGLTVKDAPQFGSGAFTATGIGTQYGTICTIHQQASNGRIIETSASASDLTVQDLCAVAGRLAPLFKG
jgi:hypothetical protein